MKEKHIIPQFWGDLRKTVLRGKFVAANTCVKERRKISINNIIFHIKKLDMYKIDKQQVEKWDFMGAQLVNNPPAM